MFTDRTFLFNLFHFYLWSTKEGLDFSLLYHFVTCYLLKFSCVITWVSALQFGWALKAGWELAQAWWLFLLQGRSWCPFFFGLLGKTGVFKDSANSSPHFPCRSYLVCFTVGLGLPDSHLFECGWSGWERSVIKCFQGAHGPMCCLRFFQSPVALGYGSWSISAGLC